MEKINRQNKDMINVSSKAESRWGSFKNLSTCYIEKIFMQNKEVLKTVEKAGRAV